MTISEVTICNLGLAKIGHEGFITSLTEDSKGARYMNVFYEPMRDAVLRQHLWRFARKRAVLAPLVDTVPFDGGYYFQIPEDCLRIIGTDQAYFHGGEPWKREGQRIIAAQNVLNIVYIKRVVDPSEFDPMFVDVLASRLGYETSLSITKSQSVKDQMEREYSKSLLRAAHASATEQDGEKFIAEAFLEVR